MAIIPSDVGITAGVGTLVNTVNITNGGNTDVRQVNCVGGPDLADLTNIAAVTGSVPSSSALGLVVRDLSGADATAAISITANAQTVALTVSGHQSFSVVLTGTWTGTIVFEISVDGTTWVGADVYSESGETWVTSAIANGSWWFEGIGAVNAVRVRSTAWTSGTATGVILASMSAMNTPEYEAGTGSAVPPNAVLMGCTDGTNLRGVSGDSSGNLAFKRKPDATSTFAPTNVDSIALESSHILKASAGVLYGFTGYSARTTAQFIQVHNTTTLPADTAVPIVVIFIPPGPVSFSWDAPAELGKFFSTGITICNSSTGPTKNLGSADCWFNASIS